MCVSEIYPSEAVVLFVWSMRINDVMGWTFCSSVAGRSIQGLAGLSVSGGLVLYICVGLLWSSSGSVHIEHLEMRNSHSIASAARMAGCSL